MTPLEAVREVDEALRAAMEPEAVCDDCGGDIASTEAVVLGHMAYCASCGFDHAAHVLSPLLLSCWTPVEVESGRREYEEAASVLSLLCMRIGARLGRES